MARAKRESDEAYNARRRAKRLIERLKRDLGESARLLSERLGELVSSSYKKAGAKASESIERLERITKPVREQRRSSRTARRNAIFRQAFSQRPEAESKVFWRATQSIWEDGSPAKRFENIEAYFKGEGKQARAFLEWFARKLNPDADDSQIADILEDARKLEKLRADASLDDIYEYVVSKNSKAIDELEASDESPDNYNAALSKVVLYG